MNEELKNYIKDLIDQIQEKYEQSSTESDQESPDIKSFRLGSNFAYFDVLDLIKSQLIAFGYDTEKFGDITPGIAKKCK